jgi:hypothetical protein
LCLKAQVGLDVELDPIHLEIIKNQGEETLLIESNKETYARNCPSCGHKKYEKTALAVVSPWIRELGVTNKILSRYFTCAICGSGWMGLRYSEAGMRALYKDYRGPRYTEIRNKWEGWYGASYNLGHESENWVKHRALAIREFLGDYVTLSEYHVVDVGGDTGQISQQLGAKSTEVVELSDRNVTSENFSESESSDTRNRSGKKLAILAHVLEHVSDPTTTIRQLLVEYPIVYVEIPAGVPQISKARQSLLAPMTNILSSMTHQSWRRLSTPSAGRRNPAQVLRCSEHLTFFSNEGLFRLAKLLECEVRVTTREILAPGSTNETLNILQAAFSRTQLGANSR